MGNRHCPQPEHEAMSLREEAKKAAENVPWGFSGMHDEDGNELKTSPTREDIAEAVSDIWEPLLREAHDMLCGTTPGPWGEDWPIRILVQKLKEALGD